MCRILFSVVTAIACISESHPLRNCGQQWWSEDWKQDGESQTVSLGNSTRWVIQMKTASVSWKSLRKMAPWFFVSVNVVLKQSLFMAHSFYLFTCFLFFSWKWESLRLCETSRNADPNKYGRSKGDNPQTSLWALPPTQTGRDGIFRCRCQEVNTTFMLEKTSFKIYV